MSSEIPVVTLDGPSGSGKGTMAARISQVLGWHLLDSGALYRIVGYEAIQQTPDILAQLDSKAIDKSIKQQAVEKCLALTNSLQIAFRTDPSDGNDATTVEVFSNGANISKSIRTEDVGKAASIVASIPEVREALLNYQTSARKTPGLVADGRDMGTNIFPDATLKFYLTASAETRAERRYNQLRAAGKDVSLAGILADVKERDEKDSNRAVSPLRPAKDAIIIDSTELDIDAVYSKMEACLLEHGLLK